MKEIDFMEVGNNKKPVSKLDVKLAKKDLSVYDKKIESLKKQMDSFDVDSDESVVKCTEMVAMGASLLKTMDAKRKETIKEADTFVRSVNRFVKIYRDKIEAIVRAGKKKIGAYQYEKEMKRRENERKAQQEADNIQEEMNRRAKAAGVDPIELPPMVAERNTGPVRSQSGTASTTMVWTWDAEDNAMDVCPRDYLTLDEKAIDQAIKAGIRKIPGIRIFERPKVIIRTS
jgi:hypothetical protein